MIRFVVPRAVSDVEVLIEEEAIQRRVGEIGEQLTRDLCGLTPVFVAILRGAAIFHADLVRQVDLRLKVDYLSVKSYGNATTSSGRVQLVKDLESSIRGEDVVLVEDIVDTGLTVSYLVRSLLTRQPRSLRVCALLSKPARREVDVAIDYLGFEVPDRFVVGYGLDYAERYRNLPFIGLLPEDRTEG